MRHLIDTYGSAGILTSCPSTTRFRLVLGPTNPGPSCVAQETLGLRRAGFSPAFLLLMPTFSLLYRPRTLTGPASSNRERSATASDSCRQPSTSALGFSPDIFSAHNGLTSELLRFL
jgi:hypothetical protein